MAGRCPGSGRPTRRRVLSTPLVPGSQSGSGDCARQRELPQTPPGPGPDCGPGGEGAGEARASRWRRLFRRSPASLRAWQAPAPAGASLKRAAGLEVSLRYWPPAQPRQAAGPASPPSPRVCEVGLTWQSLRGGGSAQPAVTLLLPWPHEARSRGCNSGRRPPLPLAPDPGRPIFRWAHPGSPGACGCAEARRGWERT